MVSILPKSAFTLFPVVVLLCGSAGNQLHALCNRLVAVNKNEQVDMVGGHRVIEDIKTITLFGFESPSHPMLPVPGKFQQKIFLMTAVSDVPYMARQKNVDLRVPLPYSLKARCCLKNRQFSS
jgi:hypothetical protein